MTQNNQTIEQGLERLMNMSDDEYRKFLEKIETKILNPVYISK